MHVFSTLHNQELAEGGLDRAGAADPVKRDEAAALSATTQRAGQHRRGLSELRRADEVYRAAEIG